jgi:DNA-binding CsgD family transcriptional regulator
MKPRNPPGQARSRTDPPARPGPRRSPRSARVTASEGSSGSARRLIPRVLTCLLVVSDVGLELALRSAVELLGVTCETLSLGRLAELMRSREVDLARLAATSFLIVDPRTESLPPLQGLMRRLEGRLVRVASAAGPSSRRSRGWLRLDPEAPLLEIVDSLRQWLHRSTPGASLKGVAKPAMETLTLREIQVLELLSAGKRYVDIAQGLGISVDTVRSHLRRIYPKLGVQSRTAAVSAHVRRKDAS